MQKGRAFFYVCAGIFLLALSYHLGATTATAQVGSQVAGVVWVSGRVLVMTSNGDVYSRPYAYQGVDGVSFYSPLARDGNFWSGAQPTLARPESWGQVKVDHR